MALLRSVVLCFLSSNLLVSAAVCAVDDAMYRRNPFHESCAADERPDLESEVARMPLDQGVILLQQAVKHRSGDPGAEELETILAEMSNVVSTRAQQPTKAPAAGTPPPAANPEPQAAPAAPAVQTGDSSSFARIAPFGKEDTAQELQHHAARTQDTLVDAVENAEVAEIKRAVFRALTRLRAASIKEFDTIARLETQAIDEYNDAHHYRAENPLSYLHADEPQVTEDKFTSFH